MSRHDTWIKFRDAHREDFELTGVPKEIWSSEVRLKRLLSAGRADQHDFELQHMTDEHFLRLEQLVNAHYPDVQHHAGFTVFLNERLRRFGRYGYKGTPTTISPNRTHPRQ